MNPVRIAHLFPDLLNLYGDGGNVTCLKQRCLWRNIPVEVVPARYGDAVDLATVDMVFLGGGPDREQRIAVDQLFRMREELQTYVDNQGIILAICGGYQVLGKKWLLGEEEVEGLGIIDMVTKGVEGRASRLVSDIVVKSQVCEMPVVGYENHAGRTFLAEGLEPFGKVVSSVGSGNNETARADGVLYRNVLGTYLHGPLLSKNPQVADYLLEKIAKVRKAQGKEGFDVEALDDSEEIAASKYMMRRLGVG